MCLSLSAVWRPAAAAGAHRYRGIHQLQAMLQHAGHVTDVLYYELLDMPLPQLEQLKSLKVTSRHRHTRPAVRCPCSQPSLTS